MPNIILPSRGVVLPSTLKLSWKVVKIRKDAIETVSKQSGHAGVFLERSKEEVPRRLPVQWEQRLPDEAELAYYQRMCAFKPSHGVSQRWWSVPWIS